jgi:hypothetical protein
VLIAQRFLESVARVYVGRPELAPLFGQRARLFIGVTHVTLGTAFAVVLIGGVTMAASVGISPIHTAAYVVLLVGAALGVGGGLMVGVSTALILFRSMAVATKKGRLARRG